MREVMPEAGLQHGTEGSAVRPTPAAARSSERRRRFGAPAGGAGRRGADPIGLGAAQAGAGGAQGVAQAAAHGERADGGAREQGCKRRGGRAHHEGLHVFGQASRQSAGLRASERVQFGWFGAVDCL